ncbi:GTP-binding protein [Aphelenchoides avenae]|nr:GTP-binding protein [Aphelenchus avenae]
MNAQRTYDASASGYGDFGSPGTLTRRLFHGKRGALRLGVTGDKPLESWDDVPAWHCLSNAWLTRVEGSSASGSFCVHENNSTRPETDRTRWPREERQQFNVTLPDETLERLGVALGRRVLRSHVEVVLSRDASDESPHDDALPASKDVDAYIVFVESSPDAAIARQLFFLHDQQVVARHFHESKWAIRKGDTGRRCEYDVLKKAYDTIVQGEESLATVNWTESEWEVLAQYELRSLKPVIYAVSVFREDYIRQVRRM